MLEYRSIGEVWDNGLDVSVTDVQSEAATSVAFAVEGQVIPFCCGVHRYGGAANLA